MPKDDESFDDTLNDLDDVRKQLDELMETNLKKMDALFKKSAVYSVIWSIAAIAAYMIWPNGWYFWVPVVIAAICVISFISVLVIRGKLHNKLSN